MELYVCMIDEKEIGRPILIDRGFEAHTFQGACVGMAKTFLRVLKCEVLIFALLKKKSLH